MSGLRLDLSAVRRSGSGEPAAPTVVFLHGYDGTEAAFAGVEGAVPGAFAVIHLRAPLPTPDGRFSWFPPGEPGTPTLAEADAATDAVIAAIPELAGAAAQRGRLIPVGFSQGGAVALHLLRRRPEWVLAAVSIAGFTIPGTEVGDDALRERRPPVLAAWDPLDPVIVRPALQRTGGWLLDHAELTRVRLDGGRHEVTPEAIEAIAGFLTGIAERSVY